MPLTSQSSESPRTSAYRAKRSDRAPRRLPPSTALAYPISPPASTSRARADNPTRSRVHRNLSPIAEASESVMVVTDFLDATGKTDNRNRQHSPDSPGTMAELGGYDLRAVAERLEGALTDSKKFESGRELSTAAGLSKGQFHATIKQLRGGQGTNITTLVALATALECSLPWLLTGVEQREPRLMDLPGWAKVAAETSKRRPLVPDFAIAHVGTWVLPWRPTLDVTFVGDLARTWFEAASEELRSRVETDYVRARARS